MRLDQDSGSEEVGGIFTRIPYDVPMLPVVAGTTLRACAIYSNTAIRTSI